MSVFGYKPAYGRIVISCPEVNQSRFFVQILTTVANRIVDLPFFNQRVTEGVIVVGRYPFRSADCRCYVSMGILLQEIRACDTAPRYAYPRLYAGTDQVSRISLIFFALQ